MQREGADEDLARDHQSPAARHRRPHRRPRRHQLRHHRAQGRRGAAQALRRAARDARTPSCKTSPASPRTISRSRCARSRRSATGCAAKCATRLGEQGRDYLDACRTPRSACRCSSRICSSSRASPAARSRSSAAISTRSSTKCSPISKSRSRQHEAEIEVGELPDHRRRPGADAAALPEPHRQRAQVSQARRAAASCASPAASSKPAPTAFRRARRRRASARSRSPTTASASTRNSPTRSSSSSSGCTAAPNTRAPASASPSAGKLLIATAGASWQKLRTDRGATFLVTLAGQPTLRRNP